MPVDDENWHPRAFADVADKIVLMAYDEHWQGGTPGPIASNGWFLSRVAGMIKGLAPGKAVVALGSYGYDWHEGHADALTVEEAWLAATAAPRPRGTRPAAMPASPMTTMPTPPMARPAVRHDVWMLDAATSWNQMLMLRSWAWARWRSGAWVRKIPGSGRCSRPGTAAPRPARHFGASRRAATWTWKATAKSCALPPPTPGNANAQLRSRLGLVTGEHDALPTPYVVRRTGDRPKLVALTFDDGPDPTGRPDPRSWSNTTSPARSS
jgi:hypothetical protein